MLVAMAGVMRSVGKTVTAAALDAVVSTLRGFLADDDEDVRKLSAAALGVCGRWLAAEPLAELLDGTLFCQPQQTDWSQRQGCCLAIEALVRQCNAKAVVAPGGESALVLQQPKLEAWGALMCRDDKSMVKSVAAMVATEVMRHELHRPSQSLVNAL